MALKKKTTKKKPVAEKAKGKNFEKAYLWLTGQMHYRGKCKDLLEQAAKMLDE